MITERLYCPDCQGNDIVRHGTRSEGKRRYRCRECRLGRGRTFLLDYTYVGQSPGVKQQIVDMAMNAGGALLRARRNLVLCGPEIESALALACHEPPNGKGVGVWVRSAFGRSLSGPLRRTEHCRKCLAKLRTTSATRASRERYPSLTDGIGANIDLVPDEAIQCSSTNAEDSEQGAW
jgi:hypothetical protein